MKERSYPHTLGGGGWSMRSFPQCPYLYLQHWPNPSHSASSMASLLHQGLFINPFQPLYNSRTSPPRNSTSLSLSFILRPQSSLGSLGSRKLIQLWTGQTCPLLSKLAPSLHYPQG